MIARGKGSGKRVNKVKEFKYMIKKLDLSGKHRTEYTAIKL